MELDNLIKGIEKLRQELSLLFQQKGSFNDEELLEKSRKLDKLLNQFIQSLKNRERK